MIERPGLAGGGARERHGTREEQLQDRLDEDQEAHIDEGDENGAHGGRDQAAEVGPHVAQQPAKILHRSSAESGREVPRAGRLEPRFIRASQRGGISRALKK